MRKLITYDAWPEMNQTVDGVDRIGIIGTFLDDSTTIGSIPKNIDLPDGTHAILCMGTKVIAIRDGRELLMDHDGVLWEMPRTTLSDYGSKDWVKSQIASIKPFSDILSCDPSETIHNLYTYIDAGLNPKLFVSKQNIQIAQSQVDDLETDLQSLSDNFGNYYTSTQTDSAISTALGSYSTTTQMNTAISDAVGTRMTLKYSEYTAIADNATIGYTDTSTTPITIVDGITTPGVYVRTSNSSTITGRPSDYFGAFLLIVRNTSAATRFQQELYPIANISGTVSHYFYKRYYTANGWQDWTKFEGLGVSPVLPTP